MSLTELIRPIRGRPLKFGRPAHAVTLTLPDDVIAALQSADPDLSRAVVHLAHPANRAAASRPVAEIARHGRSALIVVRPCAPLRQMKGVRLVPLSDGRALISLDEALGIDAFELKMRDALDEGRSLAREDRAILAAITEILKNARLAPGVTVHQRRIIVLQSARRGKLRLQGRSAKRPEGRNAVAREAAGRVRRGR